MLGTKGDLEHSLEYAYEEAQNADELLKGICNYAAVMWFLWPTDYTPIVMLRYGNIFIFF